MYSYGKNIFFTTKKYSNKGLKWQTMHKL